MQHALGWHSLIELHGCDPGTLRDASCVREAMLEAARRANATIVTDVFHQFSPHGTSGVVVISESHLAIHTWPEHRCASVDVFSCSEKLDVTALTACLRERFRAECVESMRIERGRISRA